MARVGVVHVVGASVTGSGFVVDPAGYVLTNAHVVAGAGRLTLVFNDGTRLTPRVVASDPRRDIALLKVDTAGRLKTLAFAARVREGEEVVALGYPLQLQGGLTVTMGVVSAFRTIDGVPYVQTDAAINPGNSGGPLLNLRGEVVGMNTSVRREIEGLDFQAQGIGFAIRYDVLNSRLEIMRTGNFSAPTPAPTPAPIFGPRGGSLNHDTDEESSRLDSYTDVADFVAEVTFRIPRDIAGDRWSAGLLIRASRNAQAISIWDSGHWSHSVLPDGADEYTTVQMEFSSNIGTGPNAENHIRVVAQGDTGWLFINGIYGAELDLSGLMDSGTIVLFALSDEGTTPTQYSDFIIRPLEKVYGPESGAIEHDPGSGLIDGHDVFISTADGMIEARFFNPYPASEGDWSSAFLFRQVTSDEFHAVGVLQSGTWFHHLRAGAAESAQQLAWQDSPHVSTGPSGSNHIRIIALGGEGWLFINGAYVGELDLRGWLGTGSVSAVGAYFAGHGIEGKSTKFEGFTVWSADSSE